MNYNPSSNIEVSFDDFNFNVLNLNNNDLFYMSWFLLQKFSFFSIYNVSTEVWREFIWMMERKYDKRNNSFHNFHHALAGSDKY